MGKDMAEFNFVADGAEGFVCGPTRGIGRKETIFQFSKQHQQNRSIDKVFVPYIETAFKYMKFFG